LILGGSTYFLCKIISRIGGDGDQPERHLKKRKAPGKPGLWEEEALGKGPEKREEED